MYSPIRFARAPTRTGGIVPPTIDITNIPEPFPVSGPRPAMPRVKILGTITELKRPAIATALAALVEMTGRRRRGETTHLVPIGTAGPVECLCQPACPGRSSPCTYSCGLRVG